MCFPSICNREARHNTKILFHCFQQWATFCWDSNKQTRPKVLLFYIWDTECMVISLAKISQNHTESQNFRNWKGPQKVIFLTSLKKSFIIWSDTFNFSMLVLGHKKCHCKTWQNMTELSLQKVTAVSEVYNILWETASQNRVSGKDTDKLSSLLFYLQSSYSLLKKIK